MADNELTIKAKVEDEGVASSLADIVESFKSVGGAAEKVGELILKAIEKIKQMQDEVDKMRADMEDAALSTSRQADAIDLVNLKLEDQIAKLEGHQSSNGLKEALFESTRQAAQLSSALEGVLRKTNDLLKNQSIGFWKSLVTGMAETKDLAAKVGPAFQQLEEMQRQESLELARFDNANHETMMNGTRQQVEELGRRRIALQQHWNEQIKIVTDGVKATIGEEQKLLAAKKEAEVEQLMTPPTPSPDSFMVQEALSLADAQKQVNHENSVLEGQMEQLTLSAENYYQTAEAGVKNEQLAQKEASAQAAADARARAQQAGQELMRSLQSQLDMLKTNHQVSLAEESKFWSSKLELAAKYPNAYSEVLHRVAALDQAMDKQELEFEKWTAKQSTELIANAAKEQTALAMKRADDVIRQKIREAQEAQALAAKDLENSIEIARGEEQVAEQNAAADLARHRITKQQEIDIIAQARQKELGLEIEYYQAMQRLYAGDALKVKEIELKITKDVQEQAKVRAKAVADGINAEQKGYQQLWSSIGGTFKNMVSGLMQGNESIQQAFQKLCSGLLQDLANYEAQVLEKKLAAWIQSRMMQKEQAISQIHTAGAVGGASAYADMASMGPEGLAAAPGVAATTEASIDSRIGEVVADAGGQWEVPALQLTMLHPREMVLPAGLASRMRDVVEGRALGGAGLTVVVNHSVNAVDAESFQGVIRRHGNMIGNEIARVLRRKGVVAS